MNNCGQRKSVVTRENDDAQTFEMKEIWNDPVTIVALTDVVDKCREKIGDEATERLLRRQVIRLNEEAGEYDLPTKGE